MRQRAVQERMQWAHVARRRAYPVRLLLIAIATSFVVAAACAPDHAASNGATPIGELGIGTGTVPIEPVRGTTLPRTPSRSGSATASAPAPTPSTTLLPTTTTTELDPASMAPCEAEMAATPIAHLLFSQAGSRVPGPAAGWESPDPSSFDWNEDGVADRLIVGAPAGTVRVDWGIGGVVVRGVRTDFTGTIYDSEGHAHALNTRVGEVQPAGVADVTGDGHLDLALLHDGQMNVLTGSGPSSPSLDLAFSDVGLFTPGWQNASENLLDAVDLEPATKGISYPIPTPISSINIVGDLTGDGVADLMAFAVLERGTGPIAFYAGTPCRGR